VNHKKLFQLYREEKLTAQARRPEASDRHTSTDADPDGRQ
jgi:hypothetical protein